MVKHAKPNQQTYFVRDNYVFVITVIVITEFDCKYKPWGKSTPSI